MKLQSPQPHSSSMLLQAPSSSRMLCGICKLDSVAGEPISSPKRTQTWSLTMKKIPPNPDATSFKYFKKQLGSLCKWFYCTSCQRAGGSRFSSRMQSFAYFKVGRSGGGLERRNAADMLSGICSASLTAMQLQNLKDDNLDARLDLVCLCSCR